MGMCSKVQAKKGGSPAVGLLTILKAFPVKERNPPLTYQLVAGVKG